MSRVLLLVLLFLSASFACRVTAFAVTIGRSSSGLSLGATTIPRWSSDLPLRRQGSLPLEHWRPARRYSKTQRWSTAATNAAEVTGLPEGIVKTVSQQGSGPPLEFGDIATVKYTCYVPTTDGTPPAPFAKSEMQKVVVGDGVMIDGWELALRTMRNGERSVVRVVDPSFGYGSLGVPPVIPPHAEIEMDMEILEVQDGAALAEFANAGMIVADPSKPRTPSAIAAAYKIRQDRAAAEAASREPKQGLDAIVEKVQSFYFFGFFEGETGQQAPWFLRPAITFPLAFLIVGAAFYVSYQSGGIFERGTQVTDELDEIVVSFLDSGGNLF